MAFRIVTNAFQAGGSIPQNFTGQGADKSPGLKWEDPPEGTQSFALIVEDPDAPGASFFHWLVYDIPGDAREIEPNQHEGEELPGGMKQGLNDYGEAKYAGPFPPPGERHQYVFRLFALKEKPGLRPGLNKDELLAKMESVGIIGRAEITAFYKNLEKKRRRAG